MGETGRRGTKDLALEGAATRPGRGLVFGVGGLIVGLTLPAKPTSGSACGLSPGGRKEVFFKASARRKDQLCSFFTPLSCTNNVRVGMMPGGRALCPNEREREREREYEP